MAISADEFAVFGGNADALMLYTLLRLKHGARGGPFAIATKAMSGAGVIPGWGRARLSFSA